MFWLPAAADATATPDFQASISLLHFLCVYLFFRFDPMSVVVLFSHRFGIVNIATLYAYSILFVRLHVLTHCYFSFFFQILFLMHKPIKHFLCFALVSLLQVSIFFFLLVLFVSFCFLLCATECAVHKV